MTGIEKLLIGAFGGLSAVCVKFLGQDFDKIVHNIANLTDEQILSYKVGYAILTPILMFLGGFVAWSSEEDKRMKLVALAIAAPAMITTYAGGATQDTKKLTSQSYFISSAYATETIQQSSYEPILETIKQNGYEPLKEVLNKGTVQTIVDGVATFFGYNNAPQRYWVIVGSYKTKKEAETYAKKINSEDKQLNAWVGAIIPPHQYYPVIVGTYNYLSDAKKLKERALATRSIGDAYLSAGAKQ